MQLVRFVSVRRVSVRMEESVLLDPTRRSCRLEPLPRDPQLPPTDKRVRGAVLSLLHFGPIRRERKKACELRKLPRLGRQCNHKFENEKTTRCCHVGSLFP